MELTDCPVCLICKGKLDKKGKENTKYKISGYCKNCDIYIEIEIKFKNECEMTENEENKI